MKAVFLFSMLLLPFRLLAQKCETGDCGNGNGVMTFPFGKGARTQQPKYSGSFLNGKAHGTGEMHNQSGTTDVGTFYSGSIMHGVRHAPNGSMYEGDFINGEYTGSGKLLDNTGEGYSLYEGDFRQGMRWGFGVQYYVGGDIYTGSFVQNVPEGYGIMKTTSNTTYLGQWKNGKRNGKGVEINSKTGEQIFTGMWKDDIKVQ